MTSAVWFRVDLRLADNPAFYHAIKSSLISKTQTPILALYIISAEDWVRHDVAPVKVDFIIRNLKTLSTSLWDKYGIPLLIDSVEKSSEMPSTLLKFCETHSVSDLHFNDEYEVNESRRDQRIADLLSVNSINVHKYQDQVIVPPNTLRSKSSNTVYTIYSFFKKAWYAEVFSKRDHYLKSFDTSSIINFEKQKLSSGVKPSKVQDFVSGFELSESKRVELSRIYPAGEVEALRRLDAFADSKRMSNYKRDRDFPDLLGGTSGLSPYLASGIISVKQCFLKALSVNGGKMDTGNEGVVCWIQELIWREFYKHILVAYPRVCMNKPFKLDTMSVPWRYDDVEFRSWCEGKTGYPIVDAGMRQLNETGWMHNRVRMIVASFLTKHLLHHWMKGEKYFMKHLIDGDFVCSLQRFAFHHFKS